MSDTDRIARMAAEFGKTPAEVAELIAREEEQADARNAHRRLDTAELVANYDREVPWRCRPVVADGHLTTMASRGGEGKSLLGLALAGGVLLGEPVGGIPCRQGNVAIFDAENGPWLLGRRIVQVNTPRVPGLAIFDAEGLRLDDAGDRDWALRQVRQHDARFVVFDSLRTLVPGAKENDSDEMAPPIVALRELARATGAAVLLLHHRDKALAHDFRGSGAIRDQTDLMFVLDREEKDPEQRWRRRLRSSKMRIAAEPPDQWIGIKHHRDTITITEAAPWEPTGGREAPARDDLADQALAVLQEADGPLSGAAVARQLGREKSDGTVRRALHRLREEGRATHDRRAGWGLPRDEVATLPGIGAADTGHERAGGVATGAGGNPDHTRTGHSCQGGHTPVGGAASGNPSDNGTATDELAARVLAEFPGSHELPEDP